MFLLVMPNSSAEDPVIFLQQSQYIAQVTVAVLSAPKEVRVNTRDIVPNVKM